ncbi:MAG TPA: amphi-Trp domain-containing protein [Acidimicrobiales bacterium]
MSKHPRDVERIGSTPEVVAKLRRLADALESGKPFRIQVAGARINVPARAAFSAEHEDNVEEVEFQLRWELEDDTEAADDDVVPGDHLRDLEVP